MISKSFLNFKALLFNTLMKKLLLSFVLLFSIIQLSAQFVHLQEDFNAAVLPTGWTTNAITGSTAWSFGIDGAAFELGNNNLDGTSMAFFDDDVLSFGSLNSASLTSPSFDNSALINTNLKFDYNFREYSPANVLDSFYVEVFDGASWRQVFSVDTDDCGNWNTCIGNFPKASIDISQYANSNCQIRFTYFDGNDWSFYVGIDNVVVSSPIANDLGVIELISPVSSCQLSTNEQVTVGVFNYGTDTINNFLVSCDINNGSTILLDTVYTSLAPLDTFMYTFNSTADFSAVGFYDITSFTILVNDSSSLNDSTSVGIQNLPVFLPPYNNNFEGLSDWYSEGRTSLWELGTPNNTVINTAASGTKAFCTDTNGFYANNELSYLYSPCFDLSQMVGVPEVSFMLNTNIEANFDTLYFEVLSDLDSNWRKIETEYASQNWHPTNSFWNGSTGGWVEVKNTLLSLDSANNVQFRFKFASNSSNRNAGAAIDDFKLSFSDSVDISLDDILNPTTFSASNCGLGVENVVFQITNNGATAVDSVFMFYSVNSGVAIKDTMIGSFLPYTTLTYVLKDPIRFTALANYTLDFWLSTNGDTVAVNDSIHTIVQNTQSSNSYALPYIETFSPPNFVSGTTSRHTNDVIDSNWTRTTTDTNMNWRTADSYFYLYFGSGPAFDHTGNISSFMYTAGYSTGPSVDNHMTLESPCLDFTNSTKVIELEYWYHRYGASDPINIDILSDSIWRNIEVLTAKPQTIRDAPWANSILNLNSFQGKKVKVRFRLSTRRTFPKQMAIDDLSIIDLAQFDLKIAEIVSPVSSCNPTDSLQVTIINSGYGEVAGSIPMAFQINNSTIYRDSLDLLNPLLRGDSVSFVFKTIPSLTISNSRNSVKVWSNFTLDDRKENDTLVKFVLNTSLNLSNYSENFDSFIDGTCQLSRSPNWGDVYRNGWLNNSLSEFVWSVQNGSNCNGTPSNSTGPSLDHTSGSGNYMYTESSVFQPIQDDYAILESPCVDFSSKYSAGMYFWYHRYGDSLGALYIDVFANGVWNLAIDSLVGQSQLSSVAPWKLKKVVFNQFAGQVLNVRFRAEFGQYFGDMAIDDVEFYSPIQKDARMVGIDLEQISCEQDSGLLILEVNNLGLDSILPNQLRVNYQINGGAIVTDSNTVGISVDSNLTFLLNVPNIYSLGNQIITAWVELPNDSNLYNDTLFYDIDLPARSPGYTEGFEDLITLAGQCGNFNTPLNLAWQTDSADRWVVGNHDLCSYGNSGATPISVTGPDSAYAGNSFMYFEPAFNSVVDTSNLLSTCIDLRNDSITYLDFFYHMYGAGTGKLYVDVVSNGVWLRVDSIIGQQHFFGNDPWSLKTISLIQFTGEVIRIRFTAIELSNSSISDEGAISIDNVRISNSFPDDAGLIEIDLVQASCEQDTGQLVLDVKNSGLYAILPNQLKVNYQINGGAIVTDSNAVGISVDSSLMFLFNVPNINNLGNQRITTWVQLPNDSNLLNDTLFYDIDSSFRAPEYIEGFENLITVAGQCGNFNNPLSLAWEIDSTDRWVVGNHDICSYGSNGSTPTSFTGPDSAYAGNSFMYFEPAFNSTIDTSNLLSTCIDLRNDSIAYLDFFYHMFGAGTGKLYVDVVSNGVWNRIDSIVGQQHFSGNEPWSLNTISLNQFAGDIIRIRFTAVELSNNSTSDEGAISIDEVRIYNSFPVSINETSTSNSFQLFPNPTNGEFILRGNSFTASELVISLVDLNGRLIESRIVNPVTNSINERFDLGNQSNGVYLISIQSEGKVEVKKIVLSGR